MKVILTEAQIKTILEQKSNAQIVQGDKGDPYEYKKEGGYYYTRKKGTKDWILTRGNMASAISKKFTSPKVDIKSPAPFRMKTDDTVRYQRDTFDPYAQQTINQKKMGDFRAKQLAKGIVPVKKDSSIKPHYRIFSEFLRTRKDPLTSSDFTKEELKSMKNLILKSNTKIGSSPTNIDFPKVAGIKYGKLKTGEEKQTDLGMDKSVSYVLGNASVSDKGNYYEISDIYDFNNYYNNPEKYSLANAPETISTAIKKLFDGNLVQGVEELASYYQKLGYKGIPVRIDIPKNLS